jgi:hypothetical protein
MTEEQVLMSLPETHRLAARNLAASGWDWGRIWFLATKYGPDVIDLLQRLFSEFDSLPVAGAFKVTSTHDLPRELLDAQRDQLLKALAHNALLRASHA